MVKIKSGQRKGHSREHYIHTYIMKPTKLFESGGEGGREIREYIRGGELTQTMLYAFMILSQ
jgi:hypothetical protein